MNMAEFDPSFVRQRNEELPQEVRTRQLEKRLRANEEVGRHGPHEGKGVLLGVRRIALILVVTMITTARTS